MRRRPVSGARGSTVRPLQPPRPVRFICGALLIVFIAASRVGRGPFELPISVIRSKYAYILKYYESPHGRRTARHAGRGEAGTEDERKTRWRDGRARAARVKLSALPFAFRDFELYTLSFCVAVGCVPFLFGRVVFTRLTLCDV